MSFINHRFEEIALTDILHDENSGAIISCEKCTVLQNIRFFDHLELKEDFAPEGNS